MAQSIVGYTKDILPEKVVYTGRTTATATVIIDNVPSSPTFAQIGVDVNTSILGDKVDIADHSLKLQEEEGIKKLSVNISKDPLNLLSLEEDGLDVSLDVKKFATKEWVEDQEYLVDADLAPVRQEVQRKQDKLTAGSHIIIDRNNVISADVADLEQRMTRAEGNIEDLDDITAEQGSLLTRTTQLAQQNSQEIIRVEHELHTELNKKQDALTAGEGITITKVGNDTVISSTGGGGGTGNYNDLQNKPRINGHELFGDKTASELGINVPTKVSQLQNDAQYVTVSYHDATKQNVINDLEEIRSSAATAMQPGDNISDLDNDAGYITNSALDGYATEQWVSSQGYLTEHQHIKTINHQTITGDGDVEIDTGKVDDVRVNGSSVVTNKIANITIPDIVMGRNFITNVKVGHLEAGTQINATDKIADILYAMLFKEPSAELKFYYGAADVIPSSLEGLTEVDNIDVEELLTQGIIQNIATGDPQTEEGQYPVIAISKVPSKLIGLSQWSAQGAESIPLDFVCVDTQDAYIYYIPTQTYDEDIGGTNYVLTFEEEI